MAKKLLQTKELIRDLMIDTFKGAFPEVENLQSFPFLGNNIVLSEQESSDHKLREGYYWLWLLPSGGTILYSICKGFFYLQRQPTQVAFLRDETQLACCAEGYCNTYVIRSYAYRRVNKFSDSVEPIVDFTGVAVEYQFTRRFVKIPEYFEVLEADVLEDVDEKKKFIESWKNVDNELEGFEIPVLLKGFILESDYEYYKNLISKINLEQLKIDYDKFGTEAFSDLENGAGASVTQTCLYFNMVRSLQDKLKDSSNAHLTADQGTDYEIRFPSFKNMEDLLSRRDELFVSSKSDEEIKAFVQDYDKKLWYDQMQFDVRAKVVITGYDAENRPQAKLLSPNF